jgi:hypothetical protein
MYEDIGSRSVNVAICCGYVGKLPGDTTENVFDAKILEPGKLIPATGMRAIVNVAVPAARGQYCIDMRLIPIFT